MPQKPSDLLPLKSVLGLALQLGFAVATTAVLCVFGGHWLDGKLGTTPLFFWVGAGLGLVLSLGLVWQIVRPLREHVDMSDSLEKNTKQK